MWVQAGVAGLHLALHQAECQLRHLMEFWADGCARAHHSARLAELHTLLVQGVPGHCLRRHGRRFAVVREPPHSSAVQGAAAADRCSAPWCCRVCRLEVFAHRGADRPCEGSSASLKASSLGSAHLERSVRAAALLLRPSSGMHTVRVLPNHAGVQQESQLACTGKCVYTRRHGQEEWSRCH